MSSTTTYLGLFKPSDGDGNLNNQNWSDEVNANFDTLDSVLGQQTFYASAYGVVADGAGDGLTGTDNYAAIQLLVAAVVAAGGGRIIWPEGVVYVGQYVTVANGLSSFRFEDCSYLVMECEGTTFDITGDFHRAVSTTTSCGFLFRDCTNVTINGGTFDGNVDHMTRDSVTEGGGVGLNFQGTNGINLTNVAAHHWYADGFGIGFSAFTSGGPPRKVCHDIVMTNCHAYANGRQAMSITGARRGSYINCSFDRSGLTDEDGTAVGGYTGHAPQMGVDVEIGIKAGSDDNDMEDILSDHRFLNCTFLDNLGKCFGSGHPNNQSRIILDGCYMRALDGQGDYAVIMASADSSIINSVIDCGDEASVWLGFTANDAALTGASYSGGFITFDLGTAVPEWDIGTRVQIFGSDPSTYDGVYRVYDWPTDSTFRVQVAADPGAYVGDGTYQRLMTGLFQGNVVVGEQRLVNAGYEWGRYRIIDNDIIGMYTGVIPISGPLISYADEFALNRIFISADGHDGTTLDTGPTIAAAIVHDNRYSTDLENRGDATLYFITVYTNAERVYNEHFLSGTYFRPFGGGSASFDTDTSAFTKGVGRLSGTATWNPSDIATGAATSTTVTVTGAEMGDVVTCGFTVAVPALSFMVGAVTAADTVTVTLFNVTGGNLNLGSGTLNVAVLKPGA